MKLSPLEWGGLGFGPDPSSSDKDKVKSYDLTPVNEALSRNDYEKIIRSPDLFWLMFCQIVAPNRSLDKKEFPLKIEDRAVKLQPNEYSTKKIERLVKNLQAIFETGYDKRGSVVALRVKHGLEIYIEQARDVIDRSGWLSSKDGEPCFFKRDFKKYIKPYIETLALAIGARCTRVMVDQRIICKVDDHPILDSDDVKSVKGYKIEWLPGKSYVYPVAKKKIIGPRDHQHTLCLMYEKKQLLDFTLKGNDGEVKVHAVALYAYGGGIIGQVTVNGMKESKEKTVELDNYSQKTLKVFADYLYYGIEMLSTSSLEEREVDVMELLDFAYMYQIEPLVNACTNLMSLSATLNDRTEIRKMGELYENDHLRKLSSHLELAHQLGNMFRIVDDLD